MLQYGATFLPTYFCIWAPLRVLCTLQQIWVTLNYCCGLCTKHYGRHRYDISPPYSSCLQLVLFIPWGTLEVFRAGCVSWSCTEDLSPNIVGNILARWSLHTIIFLCGASLVLPVWCSAHLEFIQNSSECVLTVPKALALKEMHHVPDSSLPLHPFLRNSLIQPVLNSQVFSLFCLVWSLTLIVHWILKVRKSMLSRIYPWQ